MEHAILPSRFMLLQTRLYCWKRTATRYKLAITVSQMLSEGYSPNYPALVTFQAPGLYYTIQGYSYDFRRVFRGRKMCLK